ncbi:LGFP repeat-containing protein, partial [Mycobacterium sp. NAZ190054]|uniref:LGFP repeat-containing protein n=1 Tax=Mycobacterium sp. NAZ190054 TaxID=1747766 RepID=UPI001E5BAEAE
MSRQPTLRLGLVGRLTVGLLGVAVALLLAPPAAAQPEVEANNAITAAWQAGGGDTGPLGPRSGDVYPAGDGFAQNFAAGKMFFTPATGAHFMQGAILEKYESLGGPADSDLGFPTIDEGPGRAPGSRNSTLSAPDNPVIFWTPATGARVVRGAINAAWDRLGGSSGVLGVPADDETYDGSVVSQRFTGGELSYDSRAKTFTTVPPELAGQLAGLEVPDDPVTAINAARRAAGGPLGPLGAAEGEPYEIGADGMGQDFVNGKIFYSPQTGANVVTGQVLAKYESVGGPEGDLGFPITSERDGGLAPASRISAFAAEDKPVIFWTPDHGAVIVRGAMNAAWDKLGGATGELGAPVADQTQDGDVITQRFSGGVISWDTEAKKFSTEPAGLAPQLVGLEVPGDQPPQAPPPPAQASENSESSGLKWTWWWLLAIVPLLLLAGLAAFAVVRARSRRRDEGPFGDPFGRPAADDGHAYEPALPGGGPQLGQDGGREDELFGDRYAREGLGSLGSTASPMAGDVGAEPHTFWGSQSGGDRADEQDTAVAMTKWTKVVRRSVALSVAALVLTSCGSWKGISNVPLPGGPGT